MFKVYSILKVGNIRTFFLINPVSQQCVCSFQCKLIVHPRQKQSPPYFVEKLSPAKVDMRGENVSLFVKATGKPMPNLTWLKVRFLMHALVLFNY